MIGRELRISFFSPGNGAGSAREGGTSPISGLLSVASARLSHKCSCVFNGAANFTLKYSNIILLCFHFISCININSLPAHASHRFIWSLSRTCYCPFTPHLLPPSMSNNSSSVRRGTAPAPPLTARYRIVAYEWPWRCTIGVTAVFVNHSGEDRNLCCVRISFVVVMLLYLVEVKWCVGWLVFWVEFGEAVEAGRDHSVRFVDYHILPPTTFLHICIHFHVSRGDSQV